MTAFTPFMYLFLDLRICIGTNYCVSFVSARPTAYLCHVCTWIMTRAKWWNSFICEQHAAYLQSIWDYYVLLWAQIIGATSDETLLMTFYLKPDYIDVSLKTWVLTSDEIGIITKNLCLNCTENQLQICLTSPDGSRAITHPSAMKKAWKY